MEVDNQSKGKRGRRSKASTESLSTPKTSNANTPGEERKTYSKRERKPTKRYEIEGQSEAEEDDGSVTTPKRMPTMTPKSDKKRGRTPNDKKGVKTPNKSTENEDDTEQLKRKTQIITTENESDNSDDGNVDESLLVNARKKRGTKKEAKSKTPKKNTAKGGKEEDEFGDDDDHESEPDDETDEKDVDINESLSKDNEKQTKPASARKKRGTKKEAKSKTPKRKGAKRGKKEDDFGDDDDQENETDDETDENDVDTNESLSKDNDKQTKPASARKIRGPKAKPKTPKRKTAKGGKKEGEFGDDDDQESEPDDETNENDVDINESLSKDNDKQTKPARARKKRGAKKSASSKTPKRKDAKGGKKDDEFGDDDDQENETDDETDENDVDINESLSKDNYKQTRPASAKRVGRSPKIQNAGNKTLKPAGYSTGERRGRAPKSLQDSTPKGGNSSKGGKNVEEDEDEEEEEAIGSRSNRKRKKINYSALDSASEDESDESLAATPVKKKKRNVDGDFKGNTGLKVPKSTKKFEKNSADKVPLNCPKCEKVFDTNSAIQRHAAVEHQIWWTPENPAGEGEARSALRNIMKYKKHLNCTKCDKQINFAHYYYHHLEWCGREDERFTCEMCGNPNLKALWQHQHRLNCPSLGRKSKEAKQCETNVEESGENKNGSMTGKKRKAAQKARSMVLNLSQNQDENDHPENDEKDPDAQIDDDDDDDVDDDADDADDDDDVDDDLENLADDGPSVHRGIYKSRYSNGGGYSKYLDSYPLMLNYSRAHLSKTVLLDLLPVKAQWVKHDIKECSMYLPKAEASIRFTTSEKKVPISLKLYESSTEKGFPIMYTGLCVWKLAWCPMPVHCSDDQFLAVVGKMDHSEKFPIIHHNGRGIIQIWNVGSLSAKRYTVDEVPGLWCTIIHDYGQATEIKWCPSGCYKSNEEDLEHYSRLGLLAVSFTDGSIRIFSLPILPAPDEGEIRIYRPAPVISLLPRRQQEKIDIACSCLDWHVAGSHGKILAGYSDGSVRLFNLECQDPPLCFKTDSTSGRCHAPFQSFFAHGKLVRAVRWICNLENVVGTACENFETYYWNLNNTEFPLFQDQLFYMMTTLASSLWHQGLYTGSDDNYALNTNRGRYVEMSNIAYNYYTHVRKDEIVCLNFSAQSGCIWEVSFSNWLSYIMACDNRGNIHGMVMADTVKFAIDTKIYKYRQLLLKIDLKDENSQQKTEGKEDANNCNCEKSTCIKCNKNRNSGSEQNSVANQSPDVLQTSGHKDSSNEKSSSNDKSADTLSKIDQSGNSNSKEPDKSSQSNEATLTKQDESSVKKTTDTENSYLIFNDHFETFQSGWPDTPADTYRRVTPAALKTATFNPNHLQCTWIAYAGDAGLLRLSNIYKLLPRKASQHI